MHKFFAIILYCSLIASGCSEKGNLSIQLNLEGVNDTTEVYISSLSETTTSVDTLFPGDSKKNRLRKAASLPVFYAIRTNLAPEDAITILAAPGNRIVISGHAARLSATYQVEGSESSAKIKALTHEARKGAFMVDSLNNLLLRFVDHRNYENIKMLAEATFANELERLHKATTDFITENLSDMVALYAVYLQVTPGTFVLNGSDDLVWFEKVDSSLYPKYPSSAFVQKLHGNVVQIKEQIRLDKVQRMLSGLGQPAPEIRMETPSGTTFSLASLKGKYVLVDFWAGWCTPCREANKTLRETYRKYKGARFEIVQVSLDRNKQQWTEAIAEDSIGMWKHLSDLKYWESPVVSAYALEEIPANFLLDKEGIIIAKDLFGTKLSDKLAALLEDAK
ncbi:MAG: TlpA family protein disulfide reductase [Bacteroidales bacterium]